MLAARDLDGVTVAEALTGMRRALPGIPGQSLGGPVAAYVEAHIEQGPELEASGTAIGVVTGIQGRRRFLIEVHGEDAHAGTMPRRRRRDALSAALAMVTALERLMDDPADVVRFTVGRFVVTPNAPSVVPGYVAFTIDFRHPAADALSRLGDQRAGVPSERRSVHGDGHAGVPDGAGSVPWPGPGYGRTRRRATRALADADPLWSRPRRRKSRDRLPDRDAVRAVPGGNQPQRPEVHGVDPPRRRRARAGRDTGRHRQPMTHPPETGGGRT